MKTILLLFIAVITTASVQAQTNTFPTTGAAGIGTTTPDASSLLEIKSTSKGILIPRMTVAQRNAIVAPATGLLVYQTNSKPGFVYYNDTAWQALAPLGGNRFLSNLNAPTAVNVELLPDSNNTRNLGSITQRWKDVNLYNLKFADGTVQTTASNPYAAGAGINISGNVISTTAPAAWNLTGNAGTVAGGKNFIGTTDAVALRFKVNNQQSGYLDYNPKRGNTAFGYQSLNGGQFNTAIGFQALYSDNYEGWYNTAIGFQALSANITGSFNTANGFWALSANTTGSFNTANGQALYSNTTGSYNTANGASALSFNTTGSDNTAVGAGALYLHTAGNDNTAIGYQANYNVVGGLNVNNTTALGSGATVDASNEVRIGNTAVTSIGGQVGWTSFSDGRYKKNIKADVEGLKFINLLKPITYTVDINALDNYFDKNRKHDSVYDKMKAQMQPEADKAAKIIYNGFIAQDVEKAAQSINYNFSGVDKPQTENGLYGLRYSDFVVPLVKSVQELSKMNDSKDARIDSLEKQIDAQQKQNTDLQKQFNDLKNLVLQIQQTQQQCSPCNAATTGSVQQYNMVITDAAALEQNVPNPFANTTTIGYYLPNKFSSAKIVISDKNGRQLKQLNITVAGKGTVHVDASTLASGAYNYSLYVDGRFVASKQMILTK